MKQVGIHSGPLRWRVSIKTVSARTALAIIALVWYSKSQRSLKDKAKFIHYEARKKHDVKYDSAVCGSLTNYK